MSGSNNAVHRWQIQVGRAIVFAGTNKREAGYEFRRMIKVRKGHPPETGGRTALLLCDGKKILSSAKVSKNSCDYCAFKFVPYCTRQRYCREECQILHRAYLLRLKRIERRPVTLSTGL